MHTVVITDKHPTKEAAFQKEKGDIVGETPIKEDNSHQRIATSYQYSQTRNPNNDMINLSQPKLEGTQEVGRNSISSAQFPQPLEIKQVHIKSSKNPNVFNVCASFLVRLLQFWVPCRSSAEVYQVSHVISNVNMKPS